MARAPNHHLVKNQRTYKGPGVYIGRGSLYGNPFVIGVHGTRSEVLAKHRKWCKGLIPSPNGEQPPTRKQIMDLQDQVLICFCDPQRCHGDYYARIANPESKPRRGLFK